LLQNIKFFKGCINVIEKAQATVTEAIVALGSLEISKKLKQSYFCLIDQEAKASTMYYVLVFVTNFNQKLLNLHTEIFMQIIHFLKDALR
jgi:hypothetical protein